KIRRDGDRLLKRRDGLLPPFQSEKRIAQAVVRARESRSELDGVRERRNRVLQASLPGQAEPTLVELFGALQICFHGLPSLLHRSLFSGTTRRSSTGQLRLADETATPRISAIMRAGVGNRCKSARICCAACR